MKLKSFGCSFIYGTDLSDCPDLKPGDRLRPSNKTWPALIAKKMDLEYQCLAWPGTGNLKILNSILDHVGKEDAFFIIGWSWIDRFDYTTTDNRWKSILPNDTGSIPEYFYRNLHSQYRDKLTSLIYVKSAIDALISNNHQFIMVCQDTLMFETEWHTSGSIEYLQKNIQPYIKNFQDLTFLEWSRDQDFPVSENWHPMDAAHEAAAGYAMDHWINKFKG